MHLSLLRGSACGTVSCFYMLYKLSMQNTPPSRPGWQLLAQKLTHSMLSSLYYNYTTIPFFFLEISKKFRK